MFSVDGVRTPFAKAGTALADTEAIKLGKTAVSLLLARTGIDAAKIEDAKSTDYCRKYLGRESALGEIHDEEQLIEYCTNRCASVRPRLSVKQAIL